MSSLTSPSVNKNITRFAPKVKQRERRSSLKSIHLPTTERTTISTSSFTSQSLTTPTSSASKSKGPTTVNSSLPAADSLAQSSTSISPPLKSFTSKSTLSIPTSQSRPRRLSSTPPNTFQPPSKGEHIAVVAPPSPDQDKEPHFTSTIGSQAPVAATTSTTNTTPISTHDNSSAAIVHQRHHPQPKRRKRRTSISTDPKVATEVAESLTTLDDITHDPAEPSLMNNPMSYFTDDLSTGVVSRSFKENEMKKAATAAAATTGHEPMIKTKNDTNASLNSIELHDGSNDMDEKARRQSSPSAPQVRLVDGEIVLDTSSLYIERPLGQRQQVDYQVVEEDNTTRRINSHTHGKQQRTHGRRWTKVETDLFYQGLSRYGTDFEMISSMIPKRTRREVKHMFGRQEKVSPWKITASIMKKSSPPSQQQQQQQQQQHASQRQTV